MTAILPFPSAPAASVAQSTAGALSRWGETEAGPTDDDAAFRQLRHQTKNALQRILCQVALQPGLSSNAAGRALARDLERRIQLVAAISDALFGFTHAPEPLQKRLLSLGNSIVELLCDPGQLIRVSVEVTGRCPHPLEEIVVRVAHELIGNAVRHGMHVRLLGSIDVAVRTDGGLTTLTVCDDGWGFAADPLPGEGLAVAARLAEPFGGSVRMRRVAGLTQVSLTLSM